MLHNVYKIINLRYPTYMYQFIIFLIHNYKNRVLACFQTRPKAPLGQTSWRKEGTSNLFVTQDKLSHDIMRLVIPSNKNVFMVQNWLTNNEIILTISIIIVIRYDLKTAHHRLIHLILLISL